MNREETQTRRNTEYNVRYVESQGAPSTIIKPRNTNIFENIKLTKPKESKVNICSAVKSKQMNDDLCRLIKEDTRRKSVSVSGSYDKMNYEKKVEDLSDYIYRPGKWNVKKYEPNTLPMVKETSYSRNHTPTKQARSGSQIIKPFDNLTPQKNQISNQDVISSTSVTRLRNNTASEFNKLYQEEQRRNVVTPCNVKFEGSSTYRRSFTQIK